MPRGRRPIAKLNDELRMHLLGGGALLSPKIAAFDVPKLQRFSERLAVFDGFSEELDRPGDHSIGAFDFEAAMIIF